jgi:hypothetical protein
MRRMRKLRSGLQALWYRISPPKLKAKYQFGSPIVGLYAYGDYLVVATKLDIYVTMDGFNYERVKHEAEV